jgi:uncharacterized membrane protein
LFRTFIMKPCWILPKVFPTSIEMTMWFLYFILLVWCFTFIDLHMLNYLFITGIKPTCSWCMIF